MAPVKMTSALVILGLACGCAARTSRASRQTEDVINETSVRSHMEFLAGDAMNGRGSGTRDEWIAASYIAAQMRKWGIEPLGDDGGYVKTVSLESQEVAGSPILQAGDVRLEHGKEIIAAAVVG